MKTIVFLAIAGMALAAQGGILTGPVTNPENGHTYYLLSSSTWTKAEAEAINLGGHLVTIRNAAEDRWIFATFGSFSGALWIGLADRHKTRQYSWVSGEPVTYANWSGGQPDNRPDTGGTELYVHIWPRAHGQPGRWNDYSDRDTVLGFPLYGVVEIVPSAKIQLSLPAGSSLGESAALAASSAAVPSANPELRTSTAIELTWASDLGRVYQPQWSGSLEEPHWQNLGPPVQGTGATVSTFDSTREHPRAFYRLQVVQ